MAWYVFDLKCKEGEVSDLLYRLDVLYQDCLWDQSQVTIIWNTRETGNIQA